ncbi:MAG: phage tail tip fiber protein [Candidatus Malihini olakiniferum]
MQYGRQPRIKPQPIRSRVCVAYGTKISQLTATINGVTTEISDISSVVNATDAKLSAYLTLRIKVDANGRQYVAGMTQSIEDTDQGMQSNTIFLQDRFSIMNAAGGNPQIIFTTQGNQVITNSAVIDDATIGFAKIKDDMQSSAIGAAGNPLWKLNKNGSLIMTGQNAGGGYLTNNENILQVYEGKGFRILRLKIWGSLCLQDYKYEIR